MVGFLSIARLPIDMDTPVCLRPQSIPSGNSHRIRLCDTKPTQTVSASVSAGVFLTGGTWSDSRNKNCLIVGYSREYMVVLARGK